jgi:hypothetical protein
MKAKDLILRCFVKQDGDQWVAVCIDLCLAAQSETMDEAKQKLESMVHSYIEEALDTDREYAAQLLSRKAPFSQVMYYHWLKARMNLAKFIAAKEKPVCSKNELAFSEIMPLKLAA